MNLNHSPSEDLHHKSVDEILKKSFLDPDPIKHPRCNRGQEQHDETEVSLTPKRKCDSHRESKFGGASPLQGVMACNRAGKLSPKGLSELQESKPTNQSPDCSFKTDLVSLPAIGSFGSKIDTPVSSSTLTHSSMSSIEYKKAQFRKEAMAKSYALKTSPSHDFDNSGFEEELNSSLGLNSSESSPSTSNCAIEGISLRLQPLIRRLPRPNPLFLKKNNRHQIFQRFYLLVSDEDAPESCSNPALVYPTVHDSLAASDAADDFEPSSFATILRFSEHLEIELTRDPNRLVTMRCASDPSALSRCAFLVGAHMLLKLCSTPDEIRAAFEPILADHHPAGPRDGPAAIGEPATRLRIRDCWAGLWKAHRLGWITGCSPRGLSPGEYGRARDPMAPDVQELVPGRLVVLRGPKALPDGQAWRDVTTGDGRPVERDFAPAHHAPALRRLGVSTVVRLNAATYSADAFPAVGLAFADLPCPSGAAPPPSAAAKLLRILDAAPGAVAVHSGASLGRACALAALFAMRRHGFSAREAAGWLRAVRPGSVAGPRHLEYLVGREPVLRRASSAGGDGIAATWGASGTALAAGLGGSFGPAAAAAAGEGSGRGSARGGELAVPPPPVPVPAEGWDLVEVSRAVAEAMAEVDERLRALRATQVAGAAAAGGCVPRNGSFAVAATRAAAQAAERRRGLRRGCGGAMWRSCPSLNEEIRAAAEADGGTSGEPAAPLRFCADLLPLPTS